MQEVAAGTIKCVEEETVPEDKTLALDSDLHLPDANEDVGGHNIVDESAKNISSDGGGPEEKVQMESSAPLTGEPSAVPQVDVESVKKWKTWLLTHSQVIMIISTFFEIFY